MAFFALRASTPPRNFGEEKKRKRKREGKVKKKEKTNDPLRNPSTQRNPLQSLSVYPVPPTPFQRSRAREIGWLSTLDTNGRAPYPGHYVGRNFPRQTGSLTSATPSTRASHPHVTQSANEIVFNNRLCASSCFHQCSNARSCPSW